MQDSVGGKTFWSTLLLLGIACSGLAGETPSIDDVLAKPKGKILILGVFHFANPGLDTHKDQYPLNILSEKRQREVEEVVELLAGFQPTKVAVEWKDATSGEKTRKEYAAYLQGKFELKHNEVYQLGFRLAKRMHHPNVYLVDASGKRLEPRVDPEEYAKKHPGQERFFNDGWYEKYEKWWDLTDKAKTALTLREYFLILNDEATALREHGVYLSGEFAYGSGEEYPQIDGWLNYWYNRNLKIFANLVRITEKPGERIVLIIGSGHLGILQHLVQASPAYELISVKDYLGASN